MFMQGTESIEAILIFVTEAPLQGQCGFETQRLSCSWQGAF